MRATTILAVALALVALPGCGASAESDAKDAVKAYVKAVADGDEKEVCAMLSKVAKEQLAKADTKCEEAYENFGSYLSRQQREALRKVDPEVTVKGDRATTKIAEPPLEGEVRLEKQDGRWKVSPR